MPRLGARKLQVKLAENGHDIGRDKLFNLLRESGLPVSPWLPIGINPFGRHFSILNIFNRSGLRSVIALHLGRLQFPWSIRLCFTRDYAFSELMFRKLWKQLIVYLPTNYAPHYRWGQSRFPRKRRGLPWFSFGGRRVCPWNVCGEGQPWGCSSFFSICQLQIEKLKRWKQP